MARGGTYALVLHLQSEAEIPVGKLGLLCFSSGYYIYTGSALGGLDGRLKRHLRREKRLHWHIDYLLQSAVINEIWYAAGTTRQECGWNRMAAALPGAVPVMRGFGSSDCRCFSHLTYFAEEPSLEAFRCSFPLVEPCRRQG